MKKVKTRLLLEDALDHIERLISGERTSVYAEPIVPWDCPTFDKVTAEYIRSERMRFYLGSWVIPRIKEAIEELSK